MSSLNTTNLKHPSATGNNIVLAADGGATFQQIQGGSLTLATAQTATGTSVDFTGIPSWVKRVTVMFSGVSTNGTSNYLIQLGDSGGIENTGYLSYSYRVGASSIVGGNSRTDGFVANNPAAAAEVISGSMLISNLSGNIWTEQGVFATTVNGVSSGGSKTLSGTLDRIRITTVNGTDTFDAGTINILYEG
jgi:hypothetical protein